VRLKRERRADEWNTREDMYKEICEKIVEKMSKKTGEKEGRGKRETVINRRTKP
jgi:hypothetical protein